MPGPTTETLATDFKDLSRDLNALREEFANFRGRVDTQLGIIKWLGAFFAGILVSLVGSAVWLAWNASALTSEVRQQGLRLGKIEARLDAIERAVKEAAGDRGKAEGVPKSSELRGTEPNPRLQRTGLRPAVEPFR